MRRGGDIVNDVTDALRVGGENGLDQRSSAVQFIQQHERAGPTRPAMAPEFLHVLEVRSSKRCFECRERRRQVTACLAWKRLQHERPDIDRKSVVEGKRVSVRVDPGGRRIINKKKKNEHKST